MPFRISVAYLSYFLYPHHTITKLTMTVKLCWLTNVVYSIKIALWKSWTCHLQSFKRANEIKTNQSNNSSIISSVCCNVKIQDDSLSWVAESVNCTTAQCGYLFLKRGIINIQNKQLAGEKNLPVFVINSPDDQNNIPACITTQTS